MFVVLKTLASLVLPSTLIAVGLVVVLVLWYRKRDRAGKIVLLAVLVVYYLLSIAPVDRLLTRYFVGYVATQLPPTSEADRFDAIVVLSGGAYVGSGTSVASELNETSILRLRRGVELYQYFASEIPLVYSGDYSGNPLNGSFGEGTLAREYLRELGIPEDRIWIEGNSRTTWESAFAVRKLLEARIVHTPPYRILVVTSAMHLPRTLLSMRMAGVEAHPVSAERAVYTVRSPLDVLPSASTFASSQATMRELLGIVFYRVRFSVHGLFDS